QPGSPDFNRVGRRAARLRVAFGPIPEFDPEIARPAHHFAAKDGDERVSRSFAALLESLFDHRARFGDAFRHPGPLECLARLRSCFLQRIRIRRHQRTQNNVVTFEREIEQGHGSTMPQLQMCANPRKRNSGFAWIAPNGTYHLPPPTRGGRHAKRGGWGDAQRRRCASPHPPPRSATSTSPRGGGKSCDVSPPRSAPTPSNRRPPASLRGSSQTQSA